MKIIFNQKFVENNIIIKIHYILFEIKIIILGFVKFKYNFDIMISLHYNKFC